MHFPKRALASMSSQRSTYCSICHLLRSEESLMVCSTCKEHLNEEELNVSNFLKGPNESFPCTLPLAHQAAFHDHFPAC